MKAIRGVPVLKRSSAGRSFADCAFSRCQEDRMKKLLVRLIREDKGQDLIEYALLAGFISLAAVGAISAIGGSLNTLYTKVNTQVNDAANP